MKTLKPVESIGQELREYMNACIAYCALQTEPEKMAVSAEDEIKWVKNRINQDRLATHKAVVELLKGDSEEPQFGDRAIIEQKRYGVENEQYTHKVIGSPYSSNTWVEVPVQIPRTEVRHKYMAEVVDCITEGVGETQVLTYRVEDIKLLKSKALTDAIQKINELFGVTDMIE